MDFSFDIIDSLYYFFFIGREAQSEQKENICPMQNDAKEWRAKIEKNQR